MTRPPGPARAGLALAVLAALAACNGDDDDDASKPAPAPVTAARDAAPPPPEVEVIETSDVAILLGELDARPAWQAVIDRARLLARRDDQGAVYGVLARWDEQLWLHDEDEGEGALAIRVRAPAGMKIDAPFRAVLVGAWIAEDERWVWRAERVARIGAATAPERPPGLSPIAGDMPAEATLPSSVARAGGVVAFFVRAAPRRPGDGWVVADKADGPATARVYLPGQRESYGGQDYRTDDERWQLAIGARYAVAVGRSRPARGDALRSLFAKGAPRSVPSTAPVPSVADGAAAEADGAEPGGGEAPAADAGSS